MMMYYLATGVFAGLMSGLLGIGGGIVVVPVLAALFLNNTHIPNALAIKMAIGTSLAVMIVTLTSGLYAHHRQEMVDWKLVKTILPGLVAGVIVGTIFVHLLPAKFLQGFFSIFLLVIGIQLLFSQRNPQIEEAIKTFSTISLITISGLIGVLSSVLGAGGGTMWVPFFLYCHLKMHIAVGTSVACGLAAALFSTASFMVMGFFSESNTSYIYWPAFVGVAITSVLFSPIGAMLAHQLPNKILKRLFALFLLFVAIDMMLLG